MSYEVALEAAGAVVHQFEQFGSYQGEWFALVTYKGERGWINGSYGSCSGCDAFESEFGWHPDGCDDHRYRPNADCGACTVAMSEYQERLADFGRGYLDGLMTQEAAEEQAARNGYWDVDAAEMAAFVKAHAL